MYWQNISAARDAAHDTPWLYLSLFGSIAKYAVVLPNIDTNNPGICTTPDAQMYDIY